MTINHGVTRGELAEVLRAMDKDREVRGVDFEAVRRPKHQHCPGCPCVDGGDVCCWDECQAETCPTDECHQEG